MLNPGQISQLKYSASNGGMPGGNPTASMNDDQFNAWKTGTLTTSSPDATQAPMDITQSKSPLDLEGRGINASKKAVVTAAGDVFHTYGELPGQLAGDVTKGAEEFGRVPGSSFADEIKKSAALIKAGGRAAGDVAGAVFAPLGGAINAGTEALRNEVPEGAQLYDTAVNKFADVIGGIPEVQQFAKNHPEAGADFGRIMNLILSAGAAGEEINPGRMASEAADAAGKVKEGATSAVSSIPDALNTMRDNVTNLNPVEAMRGHADSASKDAIGKEVDSLLQSTRSISGRAQLAKLKGTDLQENLSDPSVFNGIKVARGKIVPDAAIDVLDKRIDSVLDAKRDMLPKIDQVVPEVPREALRARAIEDIQGKFTPADEKGMVRSIDEQIDALPENLKVSEVDALRAKFRASARNAQGLQKSSSEYSALENAARNIVFDTTDNLPISGAEEYKGLNDYVKNMITTKEFLDKTLRGQTVKGGRLGKMAARTLGAIAGSSHGPLGALGGAEAGGVISDIIMNNQLGSSIKMSLIKNLTDDPEILGKAQDLLGKIQDLNVPQLPAPRDEFRTKTYGPDTIELGSRSQSTVDAEERQNLSRNSGQKTPSSTDSIHTIEDTVPQNEVPDNTLKTPEELHKEATSYDPVFQASAQKAAEEAGLKYEGGPVKTLDRATEKAAHEVGDISNVKDWNRGVMFIDSFEDAPKIADAIRAIGKNLGEVQRVKYTVGDPTYNKIIVNTKSPNGVSGEVQLTTPEMWDLKTKAGAEQLYTHSRKPQTLAEVKDALEQRMEQLYTFTPSSTAAKSLSKLVDEKGNGSMDLIRKIDYAGSPNISVEPFPERSAELGEKATLGDIIDYVDKNRDLFKKRGTAVSMWVDPTTGKTHMDASVMVPKGDSGIAEKLGKMANRPSGYDLEDFKEIPYGGDGSTANLAPLAEREALVKDILQKHR